MVMCIGTQDSYPVRNPPCRRRHSSSIVYFPSQDAITASVIPRGSATMWGSGTKRKLEESEVVPEQSYYDQRQCVLNISMIKLRNQPLRKEQPLRRSVLIFNTLKHIETELKVEGVRWNLPGKPCLLDSSNDDTLEPIPIEGALNDHKLPVPSPSALGHPRAGVAMDTAPSLPCASVDSTVSDSCATTKTQELLTVSSSPLSQSTLSCPSSSIPSSMSLATSDTTSIFSDTRHGMDSLFSLPSSSSQQGPLPTFSSLLDLDSCGSSSSSSSSSTSSASSTSSSASSSPHLPASVPSPSLSHLSQHSTCRLSSILSSPCTSSSQPSPAHKWPTEGTDVFSDFDFSDLDFFSYLPTTIKLPSLSAEDLQNLPHPEPTFPPSLASSCNPKHSDLLMDDLDSIMQILVGI